MGEKDKSSSFRNEKIDRVSSPEAMDDYIRVTSPSVWLVLLALLVLLIGGLIWSIFGTMSVHTADGSVETIHPINFVTN